MQELNIELNISEENYKRELLIALGGSQIFKHKRYRGSFVFAGFALVSFVISIIIAYKNSDFGFLVFISALFLLMALVIILVSAFEYLKIKKAVNLHYSNIKGKSCNIHLSEFTIKLSIGSETYIEKWEDIKSVRLMDNYIYFSSAGKIFFIPKLSMTSGEFNDCKKFIQAVIK